MKHKAIEFTVKELNALFVEKEPGVLYHRVRPYRSHVDITEPAGTIRPDGYCRILIKRKLYYRHRLIWYMHTGDQPGGLDHIRGVEMGDAMDNLQAIDQPHNMWKSKMRSDNTSGYPGVSWYAPGNKWRADITVYGRRIPLGYFDTAEDASKAYLEAKDQYHEGSRALV